MFNWLLKRVRRDWISYDMSDLKKLEESIISDVVNKKLKFTRIVIPTTVSTDYHYITRNADISLRVDHASIGGTFSFLTVGDYDLSYVDSAKFDLDRVVETIRTGKDPGVRELSLWRC